MLDGDAGEDDVPGVGPIGQDGGGIVVAGAVEDIQESLLVLERAGDGGESVGCQKCGEHPVARGVADVQRLGHGAEIGLDAGRERRRQGQGARCLQHGQTQQMRASGGGPEDADCGGGVPAFFVVMEVDAAGDAGFRLPPRDVGREELLAGGFVHFCQREQRRHHRGGRMPTQGVGAIVVIQRVGRGAVDQCGFQRPDPAVRPEHQTVPACGPIGGYSADNLRALLVRAREGAANGVEHRDLGPMQGVVRQTVERHALDAFGEALGDGSVGHGVRSSGLGEL